MVLMGLSELSGSFWDDYRRIQMAFSIHLWGCNGVFWFQKGFVRFLEPLKHFY